MQGEPQALPQDRDKLGRYRRGYNPRISKRIRVATKLEELRREYFPNGGESAVDAGRLRLAAQHYFTAETNTDPVVAQRATRCAEFLLSRVRRPEEELPTLDEMLAWIDK
jgi:hypothetical protein